MFDERPDVTEAVNTLREAAEKLRSFPRRRPAYAAHVAQMLNDAAADLSASGRFDSCDAPLMVQQAIAIARAVMRAD